MVLGCASKQYVTKTFNPKSPNTGKELSKVSMTLTAELNKSLEGKMGLVTIPSVKENLRLLEIPESSPRLRTIGPFYQMLPQGEPFNGEIDFSFCYSDEDVEGFDENLFYIGEETTGVWKKIGGTPDPDSNCVYITLNESPAYNFGIYAGLE